VQQDQQRPILRPSLDDIQTNTICCNSLIVNNDSTSSLRTINARSEIILIERRPINHSPIHQFSEVFPIAHNLHTTLDLHPSAHSLHSPCLVYLYDILLIV
jgi:hypothetical protein